MSRYEAEFLDVQSAVFSTESVECCACDYDFAIAAKPEIPTPGTLTKSSRQHKYRKCHSVPCPKGTRFANTSGYVEHEHLTVTPI